MKFMQLFLVISTAFSFVCNEPSIDLEIIRANYQVAISDKKLCKKMIENLKSSSDNSIKLAYLGAFQTIWAKHTINPISKFNTFNKGKKNIEEAVRLDPKNLEIRIIRLSIQSNCPSFLGYRNSIEGDKRMIQSQFKSIVSVHLKKMLSGLI
ncbi:hypothetical protein [Flavobacterium sp. 3-210]